MKEFIVASASPRRRELLKNAGYEFKIIPSEADENLPEGLTVEEAVSLLAKRKAHAVFEDNRDAVVLGCDTVVALDGEILGKPADREDAKRMLRFLSGKNHKVITAVCVCDSEKEVTFTNTTEVGFYELTDGIIESYVATGECDDKAGSYGIQGYGSVLVKGIKGDYFSVMGLPVAETVRVLAGFGVTGKVEV